MPLGKKKTKIFNENATKLTSLLSLYRIRSELSAHNRTTISNRHIVYMEQLIKNIYELI